MSKKTLIATVRWQHNTEDDCGFEQVECDINQSIADVILEGLKKTGLKNIYANKLEIKRRQK